MEYIEGAPLGEHFNSLKEKGLKFSEERIWKIYIQVINHCSWLPSTCLPFSVVCLPLLDVLSCMILNNKLKASMQLYLNINGHWKMKEMLITWQKHIFNAWQFLCRWSLAWGTYTRRSILFTEISHRIISCLEKMTKLPSVSFCFICMQICLTTFHTCNVAPNSLDCPWLTEDYNVD